MDGTGCFEISAFEFWFFSYGLMTVSPSYMIEKPTFDSKLPLPTGPIPLNWYYNLVGSHWKSFKARACYRATPKDCLHSLTSRMQVPDFGHTWWQFDMPRWIRVVFWWLGPKPGPDSLLHSAYCSSQIDRHISVQVKLLMTKNSRCFSEGSSFNDSR